MAEFKGQYDDENVLYFFRKHPVVMRKGLILFMVALLIGTIPSYFPNATLNYFYFGLLGGLVLGIISALPAWVYWYFSVYIVTDQRFIQITQKGFFNKKVIDLALNQIQMVNYEVSGVQETLLGFGTITVQTFAGNLTVHNVHHPEKVQHDLLRLLRERGIATHTSTVNPMTEPNENQED